MIRFLSRAFPPGLFLIALGIVMIAMAALFEHYDLHRAQWYLGEAGLVVLSFGTLLAVAAVLALLRIPVISEGEGGDG